MLSISKNLETFLYNNKRIKPKNKFLSYHLQIIFSHVFFIISMSFTLNHVIKTDVYHIYAFKKYNL